MRKQSIIEPGKIVADTFEFFGSIVGKLQSSDKPKTPDVSGIDISRLISEEEMADPAKLYARNDTVPDIRFKKSLSTPFLDILDGTFQSPVQTVFPETNTVYVKHYRLKHASPHRPTVIMINGLNLDSNFYFDWWCWRFAAWGLDSALLMMPFSQKRVPKGSFSGHYAFCADTRWTLLTFKHTFLDTQLFANWLKANTSGLIGSFGVSFGALVSGVFACQSDKIDFSVIGMPPVDVAAIFQNWDFSDELRAREAQGETTLLTDPRIPLNCNMTRMQPKIDKNRFFVAKGLYDHLVPPESIDEAISSWGGLKWLREYPTGHLNTFVFNLKFIDDVHSFIKEEIL